MKLASLVVLLANGQTSGLFGERIEPLLEAARKVRESGEFDGKAALGGAVLSSQRLGPALRFRCSTQAEPPKAAKSKK